MKITKKHLLAGIMSISLALALVVPAVVGAAVDLPSDTPQLSDFTDAGLGDAGLNDLLQGGIQIFLALLGVIAVLIILWGGFIWMTAVGEPDKVEKAKKLIYAGITGLIIIFAAYAIATFVIDALQSATGGTLT